MSHREQEGTSQVVRLLRIEAINFDQAIGDTNQLSVIRGGALAMREVIASIAVILDNYALFEDSVEIQAISTGGSIGIFVVKANDSQQQEIRAMVERYLHGEKLSEQGGDSISNLAPLLCFAVASEAINSDKTVIQEIEFSAFNKANERALTEIRLAQLRQSSIVHHSYPSKKVCAWDGLRSADQGLGSAEGGKIPVSNSVFQRYKFGRDAKQNGPLYRFYERELTKATAETDRESNQTLGTLRQIFSGGGVADDSTGEETDIAGSFPRDFADICGPSVESRHATKLAVIYADGNKFGDLSRKTIESVEDYRKWDEALQRERASFLKRLLEWLHKRRPPNKNAPIPLEVLLWGGDEVMYVLPAELALEGVARFFEFNQGMKWNGVLLTHSLGLVICSYKTPIHRVKALAVDLAENVKSELGSDVQEQKNAWQYAVLESVDTPTDLDTFYRKRYDALATSLAPILVEGSQSFEEQLETVRNIHPKLPRSQLYMMARELSENPVSNDAIKRFEQVTGTTFQELSKEIRKIFPTLKTVKANHANAWNLVHWAELFDYWPVEVTGEEFDEEGRSPKEATQ